MTDSSIRPPASAVHFSKPRRIARAATLAALAASPLASAAFASPASAADQPQWGRGPSRNMVSSEKNLPDGFDPATGRNVKWSAQLGTQSYATPVVAGGRVLIGTNNDNPRDNRHVGDRGVLLCLDESDGHLLWQLVVPKISQDEHDPYLDWPKVGLASTPTIQGDRAYTLTNRGEVVCLDMKGMADGNDGPFKDEARHMVPRGYTPLEPAKDDADILWLTDLVKEANVHIHDQVEGSPLIDGDLLYVNSCNGVDNTHRKIRSPEAPSLVVLDKRTGRLVARDDEHIGPDVFHCTWSSPSLGEVNGRRLVFFAGGNGICYAFEALKGVPSEGHEGQQGQVAKLKTVWRYDPDPQAPKHDVHRYVSNRKEGPSVIMGMPVFHDGRVYLTAGGDLWWGKHQAWLKCVDAAATANPPGAALATAPATGPAVPEAKEVWSYPLSRESCCTPAVYDGMVFAADCGRVVHCVDAATGKRYWAHKADGEIWASPLIADGKIYIGTRRGQLLVMAATREERVIATTDLHEPISGTVTAANGVLFVPTMTHLYAAGAGNPKSEIRSTKQIRSKNDRSTKE